MLNVVLWLTEICVCCAFVPDYNPSNSNWMRPQSLCAAETRNNSSNQLHLKNSNSVFTDKLNPETFSYRKIPRLLYPGYFNDAKNPQLSFLQKKSCDQISSSNDNKFEMTVANHIEKIDGSNKNTWNVNNRDESNRIGSEIFQKDSLVISPTLLIGRKNNSGFKNSWVLTNSPTNVYIGDEEVSGRNVIDSSSIKFNSLNGDQKESDSFISKKHFSLNSDCSGGDCNDFIIKKPSKLVKPLNLNKPVRYKKKKINKRCKGFNTTNTEDINCDKRLNLFQIYEGSDGKEIKLKEHETDDILNRKLNDEQYQDSNCTGGNSVLAVKKSSKLKTPFEIFNMNKECRKNSDVSLRLDQDNFDNVISDVNICHKIKIPDEKSSDPSKVKCRRGLNCLKGGGVEKHKSKRRCPKYDNSNNLDNLTRRRWWFKKRLFQKFRPSSEPKYMDYLESRRYHSDLMEDPDYSLDNCILDNIDQENDIEDLDSFAEDSEDDDLSFNEDDYKVETSNDNDYDMKYFGNDNIYQSKKSKSNIKRAHPVKSENYKISTENTFGPSDLPSYPKNEKLVSNNQCLLNKVLLKPSSFLNESTLYRNKAQYVILSEMDLKRLINDRIRMETSTFPVQTTERVTDTVLLSFNNLSQVNKYDVASLLRDPDLLFNTILVTPLKSRCESFSKRRCVCSPHGLAEFFSNEIENLSGNKLLKKLIIYSCTEFVPIQDCYRISLDMKPRLIFNKKMELVESVNGPDEISPVEFEELIMTGWDEEGADLFVFPSTTVEIPCFTSNQMKLSPNIQDSACYKWTHSNQNAITEGRILEDPNHKGSLIIQDVTLSDSDNYTCRVNYVDPENLVLVSKTFVHTVIVVVLPQLALHSNIHYNTTGACDQELLELFEIYVPQQIEAAICDCDGDSGRSLCSVQIHNPVCYSTIGQDSMRKTGPRIHWRSDFSKTRWFQHILLEEDESKMLSVNYQLDLKRLSSFVPEVFNRSLCSPQCQQKIYLKTIEILRDSFLDALLLPVRTATAEYQPLPDSVDVKVMLACDRGLELEDGFCCPCKKHFFSEQGATVCQPCPPGTYQDCIGSKSCIPCPHPFRDNCFTMASFMNITSILVIGVCCVAMVFVIYCYGYKIIYKLKNSNEICNKFKSKIRKKKPEPLPPDFDALSDK